MIRRPRHVVGLGGLAILGVAGALRAATASGPAALVINETRSLPRGLYVLSSDPTLRVGRVVALPQPAAARTYLAGLGVPATTRLLKRIAATPGQAVCAEAGVLHTPYASAQVLRRDRRGVRLEPWQGCRALRSNEVLLLGDGVASFDGRYFGPVRINEIEAVYTEVLRW